MTLVHLADTGDFFDFVKNFVSFWYAWEAKLMLSPPPIAAVSKPAFWTALFPTYVGAIVWVGPYLREPRLSALVLFRN